MALNFLLNESPSETGYPFQIYIIIAIAVSALLLALAIVAVIRIRTKKRIQAEPAEETAYEDDGEIIAAITAAITLILEEEAAENKTEVPRFRVVAFRRTNNRRIGEQ